jgi:hypothetical protein
MIHNVYVIDQNTGICLIHRKYGSIEFNQDLVSGFLTALKDFSFEFSKGSGELEVIDMQIFYIMLVFREGVLVTAAADKNDDIKIVHKNLNEIIDAFLEKYEDALVDWSGDIRIFKGFNDTLDEILEDGKVAEVPLTIPILKIYKKAFKKSQSLLSKKGLKLSENDLKPSSKKRPDWTKEDKLPKQIINQGFLTKEEYEIAHLADGFHTVGEIAKEVGRPESKIELIIDKLDDLGLLRFIEIK